MDMQSEYPDKPVYPKPSEILGAMRGQGMSVQAWIDQKPKPSQPTPDHYSSPIQVWDFVVSNALGFMEGNIVKYVSRYLKKDGLKDLYKARDYLNKLIGLEEAKRGSGS